MSTKESNYLQNMNDLTYYVSDLHCSTAFSNNKDMSIGALIQVASHEAL